MRMRAGGVRLLRLNVLGVTAVTSVLALTLAGCGTSPMSGTGRGTATAATAHPSPTSTATTAPQPGYPMPGWTKAGPAFATAIAFAPGAPSVAYACGVNGQTDAQGLGLIGFAGSQDGGHTWATGSTPGHSLV